VIREQLETQYFSKAQPFFDKTLKEGFVIPAVIPA
jgi:hypothetical protein